MQDLYREIQASLERTRNRLKEIDSHLKQTNLHIQAFQRTIQSNRKVDSHGQSLRCK